VVQFGFPEVSATRRTFQPPFTHGWFNCKSNGWLLEYHPQVETVESALSCCLGGIRRIEKATARLMSRANQNARTHVLLSELDRVKSILHYCAKAQGLSVTKQRGGGCQFQSPLP
jgi:hypothetical protein